MANDDHRGIGKTRKGKEGGRCNRTLCQATGAVWYNHGSDAWYCPDCRRAIEFDGFNMREWNAHWLPRFGHPMFETREMMAARASKEGR